MTSEHDFCRALLSDARDKARAAGVTVPKRLTAIKSTRNLYFVEMDGAPGEYVKAECSYSAKAKLIFNRIEAAAALAERGRGIA